MLLKTCRKSLYTCIVKHLKSVNNSRTITTCIIISIWYQYKHIKMLEKIFHFILKFKKKNTLQYYSNTCNAILALLHIKIIGA